MKKVIAVIMTALTIAFTIIPTYAAIYPASGGMPTSLPHDVPDTWRVDNYGTMVTGQVYSYVDDNWIATGGQGNYRLSIKPSFTIPIQVSVPWDNTYNGETVVYDPLVITEHYFRNDNSVPVSYQVVPWITDTTATTNITALYYPTTDSSANKGAMFIGQFAGFRDLEDTGEICDGFGVRLSNNAAGFTYYIQGTYYYYNDDTGLTGEFYVDNTTYVLAGNSAYFPPHKFSVELNANDYTHYVFDGIIYWNWTNSTTPGVYVHYHKDFGARADVVDGALDDHYYYGDMLFGDNCILSYMYAYAMHKNNSSSGVGTKYVTVQTNGTYTYDVSAYDEIQVTVDVVGGGDPPSPGNVLTIEENGFYDVTQYNYVDVDVPQEIIEQELPSNMFTWLLEVAGGFLKFEIAPNFTIGGIMILCVGFALIMWLLKVFLGG